MRLLVFGYGFSGRVLARRMASQGWTVAATFRDAAGRDRIEADGFEAIEAGDREALSRALAETRAILVNAPPGPEGCPGLNALVPAMAQAAAFPDWIGYLSTTGVYGDRRGRWVTEQSRLAAQSVEGARRVGAERDWLEVGRGMGLTVAIFRLPGIYGPGRSAIDNVRAGTARRIIKANQIFNRIHVADIATAVAASVRGHGSHSIYNVSDDEPCPPEDVVLFAANLLGVPPPPAIPFETAQLTPMARSFYGESKRVSNTRMRHDLGVQLAYPTYREGLQSLIASEK